MKKKHLLNAVLGFVLCLSTTASAQCESCENENGDMSSYTGTPVSNSNEYINDHLDNWYTSHGTPSFGSGNHINMWSHTGKGEGVYTEYNFEAGKRYTICYDLWQDPGSLPSSESRIALANGLTPYSYPVPTAPGTVIPTPSSSQTLPTQNWGTATSGWITITETFIASADFSQLWFYPFLAISASNPSEQANQRIDNVCINYTPCTDAVADFHLIHENSGDGKITAIDQSHANAGAHIISRVWTVETIATDRDYYPGGGTFNFIAPVSDHYLICLEVISVNEAGECCKNRFCEWIYIDVNNEPCNMDAHFGYSCITDDCIFKFSGNSSNSNRNVRSWFWDFGDGTTGEGQYPVKTYAAPGQYEVCLTIVGDNDQDAGACCYDTYCRTIDFNCKGIDYAIICDESDPAFDLGEGMTVAPTTEASNPRQTFEVFPNPASNEVTLQLDQDISKGKLVVTDIGGKMILQKELTTKREVINISKFQPGIYLITLQLQDGSTLSKKFVKQD